MTEKLPKLTLPSLAPSKRQQNVSARIAKKFYVYQRSGITIFRYTRHLVWMANLSLQERFGQRIRRLRESRKWSYTYFAVHSGLAKNTIVEVEAGRTEPRLTTIATLAQSFNKTMSELLRGL
jgi:DNA-binding XRE family transcriptional regulator